MTDRAKELENLIIYHKQLYYRGAAQISDSAYDGLEDELRILKPDSYVLQTVGYTVTNQKVPHARPMLSLDKRREVDEVVSWMDGEVCMVTDKMDGSSASLVYENGVFTLAKSRGDGVYGENLTSYFKEIHFPEILFNPLWRGKDVEIRGEVCISRTSFESLSDEMASRKLDRPNSIRNIVAGLLHKKDDLDLCVYLDFFAYEVLSDTVQTATEADKFELLEQEGFRTPRRSLAHDKATFQAVVDGYESYVEDAAYLTDGLVIAVNNVETQVGRGFTGHHPKGKLAFKFKSDTALTTVEDIVIDVGRTGRMTFVGVVSPVVLSGATVRRVTLNNVKYIQDHQINVGCQIEITRSGEVIPKHEKTLSTNGEFVFPKECPICNERLVSSDTQVDLVCPNLTCKARTYGRVANWITVTGIDNIGDGTLHKFWDLGLVTGVEDLYKLQVEDIRSIEGLGDKSASKIVTNIAGAKQITVETLLTALGIDGLGKGIAKLIVAKYQSIEELKTMNRDALVAIGGIGEVLAGNILDGMERFGWELVDNLTGLGITFTSMAVFDDIPLKDKTFVITGKLSKPRKEIQSFIENKGGKVTGSVSANTAYLVCNEPSSSSKYKKAKQLGLPILTEEQLFSMF